MHPTPLRTTGIFFFHDSTVLEGLGLQYEVPRSYSTLGKTPLDEGSARRRALYLTTRNTHKRETEFHAPGWIPTRNPSKQAAADLHHRKRGQRVWL